MRWYKLCRQDMCGYEMQRGVGMANRGTVNSEKGAPFLLNEGILRRQMDKCSVTLAKNMHVQFIKIPYAEHVLILFP